VIALMAICQAFGWAFLAGMHLYGRCYVISIYRSIDGASQIYDTVGWVRPVPWFVTEDGEESTRFHRGRNRGFCSANLDLAVLQARRALLHDSGPITSPALHCGWVWSDARGVKGRGFARAIGVDLTSPTGEPSHSGSAATSAGEGAERFRLPVPG
jgi:hypothetical protein